MTTYDENETPWFTKDRSETSANRYPSKTIGNNIVFMYPDPIIIKPFLLKRLLRCVLV